MRVLVAEDSRTQAEYLREVLTADGGHEVTVASDGLQALRAIGTGSFDLVITDIVMPGAVDGYDLCQKIKTGKHGDTPVMLMTALTDPAEVLAALAAGADAMVRKPLAPSVLLQHVDSLVATYALAKSGPLMGPVRVSFRGGEVAITSSLRQVASLLVSTFEEAVRQNQELQERGEALEEARARLDSLGGTVAPDVLSVLAAIPDVLFSVSRDFEQIHYLSPAAARLFGATADVMLQHPARWRSNIHADDLPALQAAADSAVLELTSQRCVYRFNGPSGPTRHEMRFAPSRSSADGMRLCGVLRELPPV